VHVTKSGHTWTEQRAVFVYQMIDSTICVALELVGAAPDATIDPEQA
jgi:hypothetical protein